MYKFSLPIYTIRTTTIQTDKNDLWMDKYKPVKARG